MNVFFILITALVGFGMLFLLLGLFIKRKVSKKIAACTARTEAVVKEINREVNLSAGTDSYYSWFPVFSYTVNGSEVIVRSTIGSQKKRFEVGQQVTLFYNPDKVYEYYVPQESILTVSTIFIIIGAAHIVIAATILLLLCVLR